MANNGNFVKCILIGLILLSPNIIFCQTKIFTTDSINFKEWNYNQRKIARSPEIEIIAESKNEILYSQNINDPIKIFDGKNATLAVDSNSNTYLVYEDNGIKYSFRNDPVNWAPSILISDSSEIGSSPIADCDKEGNVHILYGVKDSSDNGSTHLSSLKYVKVSEGQQQISSIIYDMNEEDNQDTLVNYTIATDLLFKEESVFLVYQLSNDSIYVLYSTDYGESWELSLKFSGFNPSLSVGFGHWPRHHGHDPINNDQTPIIEDGTIYPVILYMDYDKNLLYRYAQFYTTTKNFYWYEEIKLHEGPIDYACIDDIIIPEPFGYSYIFQKKGTLYHAFTNFKVSVILDTISYDAIASSIAYKQFDLEKVDIVWYERNMDTYEMYYQEFEKTGPEMMINVITDWDFNCSELCDRSITVNILGGIPPYSVTLSGLGLYPYHHITLTDTIGEFRFDSLCAGYYNLTVNDALWSQITTNFEFSESFSPIFLTIDSINNVSCNGSSDGSINLTVSGGTIPFSYLWSTGETTEDLDSLKAGKYWISITDGNGCTKSDTIIILEPPPVITGDIIGNATVQQSSNELYVIDDNSSSTYNWEISGGSIISGQGSDSIHIQWGTIGTGSIKVIEIDENGCKGDTISFEVTIGSTGVRYNQEESLNLYPNPFTNTAIISFKNPEKYSYTLHFKDLSGKTIKMIKNITDEKTEITRDGLPAGLYLIELRGPNIFRGKIIIQ